MIDLIKSTSVPTVNENSEELQKKLEEMQEDGTEMEKSTMEEIPEEAEPVTEEVSTGDNEAESQMEETSEETEPVTEEVSTGENEAESQTEEISEEGAGSEMESEEEEISGEGIEEKPQAEENRTEDTEEPVDEESSAEETTETTTGSAIEFEILNRIRQKPELLAALGVVLAVLVALIYTSMKKKGKKEVAGESMEKQEMGLEVGTAETVGTTEQGNEMVSSDVFPFAVGKLHEIGAREDQQDSFGSSDLSDIGTYQRKGFLSVVADGILLNHFSADRSGNRHNGYLHVRPDSLPMSDN